MKKLTPEEKYKRRFDGFIKSIAFQLQDFVQRTFDEMLITDEKELKK